MIWVRLVGKINFCWHFKNSDMLCEISVRKNEDTTKRSTKLPQDTTGDRS